MPINGNRRNAFIFKSANTLESNEDILGQSKIPPENKIVGDKECFCEEAKSMKSIETQTTIKVCALCSDLSKVNCANNAKRTRRHYRNKESLNNTYDSRNDRTRKSIMRSNGRKVKPIIRNQRRYNNNLQRRMFDYAKNIDKLEDLIGAEIIQPLTKIIHRRNINNNNNNMDIDEEISNNNNNPNNNYNRYQNEAKETAASTNTRNKKLKENGIKSKSKQIKQRIINIPKPTRSRIFTRSMARNNN